MMPTRGIATFVDVRRAGFCARGARVWFTARGLNYNDFVARGISIETLRALGDAYANHVVEVVEARDG